MKLSILIAGAILVMTSSYAQVNFNHIQLSDTLVSSASKDGVIVDLDGDGDKDLVLINRNSASNLIWFENQGSGLFSSSIEIFNYGTDWGNSMENIVVIDIDNDDDLDIISVTAYTGAVVKLINDGFQNFTRYIVDNSGSFDSWIGSVDVFNDGYPEILSENLFYTNNAGLIDSNGSSIGESGYSIVTHDFNGDNFEDIAMFTYNNEIMLLSNNGTNGFNSGQTIDTNLDFGYYNMSVCDLDGDGNEDILYPSSDYFPNSSNILKWYKSDGAGNFAINNLMVVDTNYVVTYLFASDMDNDGKKDLVASMYHDQSYAGILKCYWNDGTDGFDSSNYQIITTAIEYTVFFRAGDIDGDGDQDIITASFTGAGGIAWFQNQTIPNNNTNINAQTINEHIKVFPNPCSNTLYIDGLLPSECATYSIYSVTGCPISRGSYSGKIDVSWFNEGIYIIKVLSMGTNKSLKLFINK